VGRQANGGDRRKERKKTKRAGKVPRVAASVRDLLFWLFSFLPANGRYASGVGPPGKPGSVRLVTSSWLRESPRLKAPWRLKLPGALQDAPPILACGGKARPVFGLGRHAAFSEPYDPGPNFADSPSVFSVSSGWAFPHSASEPVPTCRRPSGTRGQWGGTGDRWLRSCLAHHRLIAGTPPAY
jgi:hypothetical protein